MSGGSQHNPNGRQSQLGSGWSPLQLQVANFLARAPQAHMASERGVTWHTPTPPPHLYHVPAPSPPDPLQAMKAGGNSVFRHTATPPDLYRHTPTPPDKHLLRHTPSPGDVKGGAPIPPAELYPHLGPGRVSVPDKLRGEELGGYPRTGVDLSLGPRSSNGGAALSVRDAPTINSLIARAQPRAGVARVDSLLERLAPAPASPHSVIVAARGRHSLSPHSPLAPNTPTPHSENEDSTDSCGAPTGSKRKRKPERIVRVSPAHVAPPPAHSPAPPSPRLPPAPPVENGDHHTTPHNGPNHPPLAPADPPTPPPHDPPPEPPTPAPPDQPTTRRKARSGSAETIDDIAAMIASTDKVEEPVKPPEPEPEAPVTIDKLKSVLASPGKETPKAEESIETKETPIPEEKQKETEKTEPLPETPQEAAAAPKRRSARISNSESTNVPVESPSEAKPAEPETSERSSEPTASSFVEVENQLEKMFAGLEEETPKLEDKPKTRKRRKSAPTKGESKVSRRAKRASSGEVRKGRGKPGRKRKEPVKDAYDSGSNASSGRSRGPYIQIRGPRDSPLSVSVVNAAAGDDDAETATSRRKDNFRNGLRTKGLHASTLGLRYDAMTADASWLCAFCRRGPHALGLGDLFGPYTVDTDCEEYKSLDEATRRKYESQANSSEVWFHELCAVWAPGVVACGARVWGLAPAVWTARATRCCVCARAGAGVACSAHGCRATAHYPCASSSHWRLQDDFQGRDDAVTCALRAQRFRCVPLPRPCHATVLCPLPVARSRLASRTHHSPRRRRHQ